MMNAVINPYENINWESVLKIPSLSHAHSRVWQYDEQPKADLQKYMDRASDAGIKHTAWSNYHNPEPFYPLTDWFETIPSGVIGSPNAEFGYFSDTGYEGMHLNTLGSFISGPHYGPRAWKNFIPKALKQLQFSDAGGITINHPKYSNLTPNLILPLLQSDQRVLGIEIVNSYIIEAGGEISTDIWDEILINGQRAWGFCVPDHGVEYGAKFTGQNILLVPSFTEHDCLRAYRSGAFYGKIFDSELAFTNITYVNNVFSVSAPLADSIRIYIDGEYTEVQAQTASVTIPEDSVYCRAEAWIKDYDWVDKNGNHHTVDERIFTNPIMFVSSKYITSNNNIESIQRVYD